MLKSSLNPYLTCEKINQQQKISKIFEENCKINHFLCDFYKFLNIETPMIESEKSELINQFGLFMILNNFEKY